MSSGMDLTAQALYRFIHELGLFHERLAQAQRYIGQARDEVEQFWDDGARRRFEAERSQIDETLNGYLRMQAPAFEQFLVERLRSLSAYLGHGVVLGPGLSSGAAGGFSSSSAAAYSPTAGVQTAETASNLAGPGVTDVILKNQAARLPANAYRDHFLAIMSNLTLSATLRAKIRQTEQGNFQLAPLSHVPDSGEVRSASDFNHHISYDDAVSQAKRLKEVVIPWVKLGAISEDFIELDKRLGLTGNDSFESTYRLFYNAGDAIKISRGPDGRPFVEAGRHRVLAAREAGLDWIPIYGKAPWDG